MIYPGQATNADQVINKLYQRRKRHPDAEVYNVTARDLDILFDYIQSTDNEIRHITESHNVLENKMLALEKQRDWLAEKLAWACEHHGGDELSCGIPDPCPYSKGLCRCVDTEKAEWLQVAKEAVGELK